MDTSLFYRRSTVTVTEGKAIQSEFLHVMTCEGSRETRNQRSVQPHRELRIPRYVSSEGKRRLAIVKKILYADWIMAW